MISPLRRQVTLTVEEPFAVYSREVLNSLVLDRAIAVGAEFIHEGVSDFSRETDGWTIRTDGGRQWRANFLVGADGAASVTRRRLVGIFKKEDLALAFGYNVMADEPRSWNQEGYRQPDVSQVETPSDSVIMHFPRNFTGYVWAFPRPGMMNFGIASKLGERTSDELRTILSDFIHEYYGGRLPAPSRVSFFGAKIPILDQASWRTLRTKGDDWALVGDAAGFVDPITGEGIYYAFKSADLLADALARINPPKNASNGRAAPESALEPRLAVSLASSFDSSGLYSSATAHYEELWRRAFGTELERASQMLSRFYRGYFFGMAFTEAMIRFAKYHQGVRSVLIKLILGQQSYVCLKKELIRRVLEFF